MNDETEHAAIPDPLPRQMGRFLADQVEHERARLRAAAETLAVLGGAR